MTRLSLRTVSLRRLACALAVGGAVATTMPACSQGEGSGQIEGRLNIPDCWTGKFNLSTDFLAAVPYRTTLQIRLQSGSDYESFSDGVTILLDDVTKVRPSGTFPGAYGQPLVVDLPPNVVAPGVPVVAESDPAIVSMTLYLQKSCTTQNATAYAVRSVTLPADATCDADALMGADPTVGCDPAKLAAAGPGTGKSLIAFTNVFDGNIDETEASQRLTAGCFDVYLADPRDNAPGVGTNPPCRGHIRGTFSFYFERGRPSQPFP